MRAILLAAVVALGGTACYSTGPEPAYAMRNGDLWGHERVAYMTDGSVVRVARDNNGDLRITEPYELRGRPVAIVNNDADGDRPIVSLMDDYQFRRLHRHIEGSAGDVQRNY